MPNAGRAVAIGRRNVGLRERFIVTDKRGGGTRWARLSNSVAADVIDQRSGTADYRDRYRQHRAAATNAKPAGSWFLLKSSLPASRNAQFASHLPTEAASCFAAHPTRPWQFWT